MIDVIECFGQDMQISEAGGDSRQAFRREVKTGNLPEARYEFFSDSRHAGGQ